MTDIQGPFSQPGNFAGAILPFSDYNKAKAVILPVPYDGTVEWHNGTRYGPRAIIEASTYLEWYDIELDAEIFKVGIHTLPDLQPSFSSPEKTIDLIHNRAAELLDDSKFIVTLGGEHSITSGIVSAFKQHFVNLSVLQLDAHADLRDEYTGTKYSHACVARRIIDICPVTQVGIRSLSFEEKQYIQSTDIKTFFYTENSLDKSARNRILNTLSDDVYITIDLDVLDPSIMCAVGTPEPGGMQWQEMLDLLRLVSHSKNIVGFDIVELCPPQGPASCVFLAAKLAYKLIGYSLIKP